MLWTPAPGAAFPGYGWVFPAGEGRVNVGLGVGVLADRTAGRRAARDLDAFLEHASRVGVLGARAPAPSPARPLGAWLKMGLVGTTPARDRVFLVGDAAGLVNPLQGEGHRASDGQRSGRSRSDPRRHRSSVRSVPRARGAHVRAVPVDDRVGPTITAAPADARRRAHPRADLTRRRPRRSPAVGRSCGTTSSTVRSPASQLASRRPRPVSGTCSPLAARTGAGSERTSRAARIHKGQGVGRRRERARRASRPPEERARSPTPASIS